MEYSRDHLLESSQRRLDICARRDVVFHLVHKRRLRDASRVGLRMLLSAGATPPPSSQCLALPSATVWALSWIPHKLTQRQCPCWPWQAAGVLSLSRSGWMRAAQHMSQQLDGSWSGRDGLAAGGIAGVVCSGDNCGRVGVHGQIKVSGGKLPELQVNGGVQLPCAARTPSSVRLPLLYVTLRQEISVCQSKQRRDADTPLHGLFACQAGGYQAGSQANLLACWALNSWQP